MGAKKVFNPQMKKDTILKFGNIAEVQLASVDYYLNEQADLVSEVHRADVKIWVRLRKGKPLVERIRSMQYHRYKVINETRGFKKGTEIKVIHNQGCNRVRQLMAIYVPSKRSPFLMTPNVQPIAIHVPSKRYPVLMKEEDIKICLDPKIESVYPESIQKAVSTLKEILNERCTLLLSKQLVVRSEKDDFVEIQKEITECAANPSRRASEHRVVE